VTRDKPPVPRSVLIDQAAAELGVSRRTIYYWIESGKLQTVRTISGGSQRVLTDSIWYQRVLLHRRN